MPEPLNPNQQPPNPAQQPVAQPAQPVSPPQPTPPPAQPAPRPSPAQPTSPAPQPVSPPAQSAPPAQPVRAGAPLPVRRPPNPRKLIYGVLGFFGCSIFLFIIFVFLFVSQTSASGENALAKSLGLDTASFINTLITLVNVVFGFFSIILFLVAIVGLFRIAMARKDDKEARSRGTRLAGVTGGLLILMVALWVGTYLFLSSKKIVTAKSGNALSAIVTDPASTLGLTAPVLIKFDGTKLPIAKKFEIIAFLWDFGDGQTSSVQNPSHTYKDKGKANGRYDVKVTVSLKDKTGGQETTQTFTDIVTISNVKLNAAFTATPSKGEAPLDVKFDASGSSAPAGEIQSYEWDFNNKNTFTDANGVTAEHTFDQSGTYTVNLRITDNTGQFAVASQDVVVALANVPTADIQIPTTDGHYYSGTQYTFQGDKSKSPSGRISKYEWDFGDQTPKATTRTATHVYKNAGNYEITLTVTDDQGAQGQATQKINVEVPTGAPLAAITTVPAMAKATDGYISGAVPFEVKFDGSASTETNGSIVDYKWDFKGDGSATAAGKQTSYVFEEPGTYNATLTVFDAQNRQASTVLIVKALPQGLQARLSANPVEGVIPLTVTFDASGSSYPGGQIVSYEWDFGDGSPKRIDVAKVVYKYTQIGTFTAKVTAIASDNTRSTVTTPVNVRPIPLKACFETTQSQGPAPLTLEFDPHCSTGTIAKYTWDFGDGQTSKTRKPMHTFQNPGSYQVKLEVSDNQNVLDSFTMSILVTGAVAN